MKKYIVYMTTNTKCKINGLNRIYIGVHETENPEIFDGYIGCGVKIQQPSSYKYPKTPFQYAVKKYGVDCFKRTVLYVYDTPEEAYQKEHDIVNDDFLKQEHVYNVALGGQYEERYKPLYQFDFSGNLVKAWERSLDAYEFYGYEGYKWDSAKRNKCSFLGFYWSTDSEIDLSYYTKEPLGKDTYLYTKHGKLLQIFESVNKCSLYLNYSCGDLCRAIKNQTLIQGKFYVSDKIVDEFKPNPRRQWMKETFFVYKEGKFIGEFMGKELMPIIGLNSWNKVNHIFTKYNNWYKDYYITLEKCNNAPIKKPSKGTSIDVYTKYGEYIETISTIGETKKKYNLPSYALKNIKLGDKYFGEYIFKYNSK